MKPKLIAVIAAVVLIAFSAVMIVRCKGSNKQPEVVYETETVTFGSIGKTITATGTVEPISKVEVGTQVSGNISKIYVDYNSVVKKGQLIAELDRTNLRSELSMQENNLASAENEMNYQKKNMERQKQLYEQHMVSDAAYEESEYKYKSAVFAYNRAKESVATAKTNLGYSYIYSPIDGVILSKSVEEGQTVAASFSTPTLFTIANNLAQMQVVANVDEADIGQVGVGQQVSFSVDAYPDETFDGKVTQIRLEAQVNSNVVTYEVVIEAPNPDLKLMPGLTANISIYVLKIDDILLLPAKALRYQPASSGKGHLEQKGDKKRVWLLEKGGCVPKTVTLGATDGINYQVTDGLKEGDKVVVGEIAGLSGMPSRPENGSMQSPFMPGPPGSRKK